MTYQNMARKYRPQTFADVAAQTHITETLRRALQSDRVASAYLFTGPRGSGKTTVARLLAKAVNCEAPKKGEPCDNCESCESIKNGRNMDVLEIDGASNNSVDDIRELREKVRYAATGAGKRKIYIIDEVHMLSAGAFNALLKTLEEPPAHVVFVFATTEVRKVPATILSRCQRFDFRRLTTQEIHERLQQVARQEKKLNKLDVSNEALFVLAKRADGSLRDALSLLDQVQSSTQGRIDEGQVAVVLGLVREEVYLDLSEAIADNDAVRSLQILHAALHDGADPTGFVLGLVEHLRNLLMLSVDDSLRDTVQLGDAHLARAGTLAARFRTEDLLYLLNRSSGIHEEVRRSSNPVVVLESAIIELAHFESRVLLRDVLDQLEGDDGGGPASPGGARTGSAPARGTPGSTPRRRRSASDAQATWAEPAAGFASTVDIAADIAAGVPPTLPGAAPTASVRAATAAPATGFGAPQVVGGGGVDASGTATMADDEAEAAFAGHVQDAFDDHEDDAGTAPAAASVLPRFEGDTLDLASLRAHWQAFTEVVRGSKAMLAHCLSEGQPRSLQNGVLAIGFSEEHAFHLNLMRENRTQRELEKHIERFFGTRLKVDLSASVAAAPADAAAVSSPERASARLTPEAVAESRREAAQDTLRRTPRLQEILDAFDGEILEDNQAEPGGT